jgi:hypothetical protein
MSSQEIAPTTEEKTTVDILGIDAPKWLVKLILVVIIAYGLYYVCTNYRQETVSLATPITAATVDTATPNAVSNIIGTNPRV